MSTERKVVLGLIVLMLALGVVWVRTSFAFPNEPTGFNNNKWGTPIEAMNLEVNLYKKLPNTKVAFYEPAVENEVFVIRLIALDGKLVGANLTSKDRSKAALREMAYTIVELYGDPMYVYEEFGALAWVGEVSVVQLYVNDGTVLYGDPAGMNSVENVLEWLMSNQKGV